MEYIFRGTHYGVCLSFTIFVLLSHLHTSCLLPLLPSPLSPSPQPCCRPSPPPHPPSVTPSLYCIFIWLSSSPSSSVPASFLSLYRDGRPLPPPLPPLPPRLPPSLYSVLYIVVAYCLEMVVIFLLLLFLLINLLLFLLIILLVSPVS